MRPKLEALKTGVSSIIDAMIPRLESVSRFLHDHPEVSFEEHMAADRLALELETDGFRVEKNVADLPTALYAERELNGDGPNVAFFAEYDALPEIGHGCGHNLIAAASLGAVLAIGKIAAELPGRALFFGTPAEEGGGGKITMMKAGLFAEVDAAMLCHPFNQTKVFIRGLAAVEVDLTFYGRTAHSAAAPEQGINALDGVIQTFCSINALRQHVPDVARIHGIITNGGARPNMVPDCAEAVFYVRGSDGDQRDALVKKIRRCAEGAAQATGCTLDFKTHCALDEMRYVPRLCGLFQKNMEAMGLTEDPEKGFPASTDMGNVSQIIPSLHAWYAICDSGVSLHTVEFARATVSGRAHEAMIKAAKAMAFTAIDLYTHPEWMDEVRKGFGRE